LREINKIIIHCSATREGQEMSVETIRSWHLKRGFSDIGYHYLIHLNGLISYGRNIKRSGAHTKGQNKNSIGVCYVGGVESKRGANGKFIAKDTRTPDQKLALLDLLKTLKRLSPNATIHGHNEFAAKSCPCFDVKNEYCNI